MWLRDLTAENIEPHPGPSSASSVASCDSLSRCGTAGDLSDDASALDSAESYAEAAASAATDAYPAVSAPKQSCSAKSRNNHPSRLKIWQINIDSWFQHGSDLLNFAKKELVDVVLVQETRLKSTEANQLSQSLCDWQMFHQHGRITKDVAHGGVAVLVRAGLAAVAVASHTGPAGEWMTAALHGVHVTSTYRRPNELEPANFKVEWNDGLAEHVASLKGPCLAAGDWNEDPRTDTVIPWAATLGAHVHCPVKRFYADEDTPPEPEPTRWASQRCIDWGLGREFQACPRVRAEKFADHKLLEWVWHEAPRQPELAQRRLKPTPRLDCPDHVTVTQWEGLLQEAWDQHRHLHVASWEDFCEKLRRVFRQAHYQAYSSQSQVPSLKNLRLKGAVAETSLTIRHHRASVSEDPSVRSARLRKLWRRQHEYFHFHHGRSNTADQQANQRTRNLRKHLKREAGALGFPSNPLEPDNRAQLQTWIQQQISSEVEERKQKRIKQWRKRLRSCDEQVFTWLKRDAVTAPFTGIYKDGKPLVGKALHREAETFWRGIWPAQTPEAVEALHAQAEAGLSVGQLRKSPVSLALLAPT